MSRYNARELRQRFGSEVRRRRRQAGLTLIDLSELASVSASHLSKIERGGNPSLAVMAALAVALEAQSFEEFFGDLVVVQPSHELLYPEEPQ